ncbi:hypothetical protein O181_039122 [Austropuccinia psidii MF-1]|uniref:Uncharacterized protein n=1 Tax=Austropuccinia psidii MF-1 TaxID=1389203 RepID=A0A9Q3HCK6_9BASI|nr:hypothetical protein [Austropuccinia psidii MF-1]
MCLKGKEAHLRSHQRLIHNQNIHNTSSLILVGMQLHPRNRWGELVDGGQQKRPLENVSQSVLSEENPGLTLHQSDEVYASSPLVHKEKVTGCHYPYSSKLRTGHSISSREKIVDDEDENMSPTQSETNDEPRRDNFTTHEQVSG